MTFAKNLSRKSIYYILIILMIIGIAFNVRFAYATETQEEETTTVDFLITESIDFVGDGKTVDLTANDFVITCVDNI